METRRGDAAAVTWIVRGDDVAAAATGIVRGDASRRRRDRDADIPRRRVALTPGAAAIHPRSRGRDPSTQARALARPRDRRARRARRFLPAPGHESCCRWRRERKGQDRLPVPRVGVLRRRLCARRALPQRRRGDAEAVPAEYESRPQNIPGAGLHGRRRRVALLPRGYFSDESRRRRGCDVDIPRYKPRRRGYSVETSRGDTATIPSEYPARSRGVAATVPLTISQVPCRRKTARVPASPFHRGRARGAGALERGGQRRRGVAPEPLDAAHTVGHRAPDAAPDGLGRPGRRPRALPDVSFPCDSQSAAIHQRTIRVVAAASLRFIRGRSASSPRRRCDSSKDDPRRRRGVTAIHQRTIRVVAAASLRFIRGRSVSGPHRLHNRILIPWTTVELPAWFPLSITHELETYRGCDAAWATKAANDLG